MRPVLIINPRSDAAFVEAVETAAADAVDPAALQSTVRARYPMTVVRPRDLSSESIAVWYVYRDGRWVPDRSG